MNFWLWLSQVPAVAYVGVIGFVGTTLTIYFNNKATADRLRQQIVEDRETDANARLFSARRDVYLAAADAAAVGIILIGQLSDTTRTASEIVKPFADASGNIAKAHIFASIATSTALLKVAAEIGTSIVELTLKRGEIDELTLAIKSSPPGETLAKLHIDRLNKLIPFAEECMSRVAAMAPYLADALAAIRNDLSVPHDGEGFKGIFIAQADKQRDHVIAAFKPIRARFGIGPQPPPPRPPGL